MCWNQFKICRKIFYCCCISEKFQNDLILHLYFSHRLSRPNNGIKIETSQNTKASKSNKDDNPQAKGKRVDKNDDPRKFEIYFKFQAYFNSIQSHQILAINRGENLKVKRRTMFDVGTESLIFGAFFLIHSFCQSKLPYRIVFNMKFTESSKRSTSKMLAIRNITPFYRPLWMMHTQRNVSHILIYRVLKYMNCICCCSKTIDKPSNSIRIDKKCRERLDRSVREESQAIVTIATGQR